MKYLISIAIGPVQDFIASARRSRDLWFGSWLLSELSKVVAQKIGEGNLVFPSNLSGNVVNKILAVLPNIDEKFDENLRKAIEKRLEDIYEPIFKSIEGKLARNKFPNNFFKKDVAIAQIKDMYELYWVAIRYDEIKDDYKVCRERVEVLLNARKATREFNAVTWGSIAPKSSLDGQRESVIDEDVIKKEEIKAQRIFGLRKKERLCGVGVLKRLAEKGTDDSFFSTSHVASLPLLSILENNEKTKKAVNDYIDELTKEVDDKDLGRVPDHLKHDVFKKYDGHLLFENRLADLSFETQDKLDKAQRALKKFMAVAFGNKDTKPLPYYALLLADGDRMGTVIDNQKTRKDHEDLSKALSEFAQAVKTIVEKKENNGSLIYAGGDDVLAFLPLHTVLDCAKELAVQFTQNLSKDTRFVDESRNPPTLSVGVAIVHHTEPLQDSLATMRDAEKDAKSVKGKNALAVILSKRSGADTPIKGSWGNDRGTGESFYERLRWFIQLHLDDALPDGVAYELRDLWLRLKELPTQTPMRKESVRILQRKYSNQGLSKVSKNILGKLEGLIQSKDVSLADLANEIIVARDFAKAYKQANKKAIGETEL
jgi:CRISPR-associated protein Cmr2